MKSLEAPPLFFFFFLFRSIFIFMFFFVEKKCKIYFTNIILSKRMNYKWQVFTELRDLIKRFLTKAMKTYTLQMTLNLGGKILYIIIVFFQMKLNFIYKQVKNN